MNQHKERERNIYCKRFLLSCIYVNVQQKDRKKYIYDVSHVYVSRANIIRKLRLKGIGGYYSHFMY